MKQKQLNFYSQINVSNKKSYGGTTKGKRKIARPFSPKKWMHLNLKAQKAKGHLSLLNPKNKSNVEAILKKQSQKHGVQIAEYVNMGNHLHIKVRASTRNGFQKFLKSITAMIARKVTGAHRSNKFGKFWDALAFTRILTSAFEELQLKGYFQANRIEAQKGYQARKHYLDQFNSWLKTLRLQT
jgi:REP element-mobilizing transposase RayT